MDLSIDHLMRGYVAGSGAVVIGLCIGYLLHWRQIPFHPPTPLTIFAIMLWAAGGVSAEIRHWNQHVMWHGTIPFAVAANTLAIIGICITFRAVHRAYRLDSH